MVIPDGGFFGFNTSVLASRGLLGGLYQNSVQIYDDILQGYTENVYVDVIEGYTIATIKLMGWFFVGSFIVFNGITLRGLNETFGRSFSDQVPASLPLLKVANPVTGLKASRCSGPWSSSGARPVHDVLLQRQAFLSGRQLGGRGGTDKIKK